MVRVSHIDCHTFHCDTLELSGSGGEGDLGAELGENFVDAIIDVLINGGEAGAPLLSHEGLGDIGTTTHAQIDEHISSSSAHIIPDMFDLAITKSNAVEFTPKFKGLLTKVDSKVIMNFENLEITGGIAEEDFDLVTAAIPVKFRPTTEKTVYGLIKEIYDIDVFGIQMVIHTDGTINIKGHKFDEPDWFFEANDELVLMSGSVTWSI